MATILRSWSSEQHWRPVIGDSDPRKISTAEAACHGQQRQHRRSCAVTIKLTCVGASCGSNQCLVVGGWSHTASWVHPLGIEPKRCPIWTPKTKSMHTLAAATARRQRHRHRSGRRRDQIVVPPHCPATNKKTARFFSFVLCSHHSPLGESMALHALLCAFIQQVWECGSPQSWASQSWSGLTHVDPSLFGNLHGSSRLLTAWGKHELPPERRRRTECGFECCCRLVSVLFSVGPDAASACSSFHR